MNFKMATSIGLFTLLAVAAIVGGQFVVMQHFENERFSAAAVYMPGPSSFSEEGIFAVPPQGIHDLELSPGSTRVTDIPVNSDDWDSGVDEQQVLADSAGQIQIIAANEELLTGDKKETDKNEQLETSAGKAKVGPFLSSGQVPEQLPQLQNASPITIDPKRDQITREIIAQELPRASAEERQIWLESLRGFSPRMARDLLSLKNMIGPFRSKKTDLLPSISPTKPESLAAPIVEVPTKLITQPRSRLFDISPSVALPAVESSIAAVRIARDVVLNNIANANTTAFKRSRVLFEDLAYQQIKLPGQQDRNGHLAPVGVAVGFGVQVAGTQFDATPGQLLKTNGKLHLAIEGDGYFQILNGSEILYTRAGTFTLNADGEFVMASAENGRPLDPAITVPQDSINVQISGDGSVSILQPTTPSMTQVGQIQLARFSNSDGLVPRGENLYAESDASGSPRIGVPGAEGRGKLKQGFLEDSNVNEQDELAELVRLQSRLEALEQARAIHSHGHEKVPASRIAETPVRNR